MTHWVRRQEVPVTDGTGKKVFKSLPIREGNKYMTRCGIMVHRRWALLRGPENPECDACCPTVAGMLRRLSVFPREIKKLIRLLKCTT